MSSNCILLPNEFDIEKLVYMNPRTNKLGGQSVLLNYSNEDSDTGGPFILQTTRVRLPFGIDESKLNKTPGEQNATPKYSISLSMANSETVNENHKRFTANIRAIDDKTKKHPVENDTWFNKKLSNELVNEFYRSAEKFPKEDKWPSTLRVRLPFDSKGRPQFHLYDEDRREINILNENGTVNMDCIPKGSEAVCLIQSTGVWFMGKTQFGVNYKLLQAKIYKSDRLQGYSIVDSDEEEEEEEEEETQR